MLTMIIAAAMAGQVYADDFYFTQAQENFVMDSIVGPKGYARFIPPELLEQVQLWSDECWRCRRNANKAVVSMGPGMIRFLFWTLRAKDLRVSMHSEAMINVLSRCRYCHGSGECPGFSPMKKFKETCDNCWYYQSSHEWHNPRCVHCNGDRFELQINEFNSGRGD